MRTTPLFWDVDTQVDFMHAYGKLYVPESEEIIPTLGRLTAYAHAREIRIMASADDHVPGHPELSETPDWRETFPDHCMRGTLGQDKIPETTLRNPLVVEPIVQDPLTLAGQVRSHNGDILVHKHWFDVFTNPNVLPMLDALAPDRIVLYGVALDVCNRYAIEGLLRHRPGIHLSLVTDATRAIDASQTTGLLTRWVECGVTLVLAEEILAA